MNSVILIGRVAQDIEVRYTAGQMAVATFTVAVDRPVKDKEKQADFPRVTVFGKLAENCERYTRKGLRIGIQGRLQTGSYKNKDGHTVYTTDVIAERIEFLEWPAENESANESAQQPDRNQQKPPQGFAAIDEDIPF